MNKKTGTKNKTFFNQCAIEAMKSLIMVWHDSSFVRAHGEFTSKDFPRLAAISHQIADAMNIENTENLRNSPHAVHLEDPEIERQKKVNFLEKKFWQKHKELDGGKK